MRHPYVRSAIAIVVATVATTAAAARTAVVNLQFGDPEQSPRYTGTGAAPDTGTTWNFFGGTSRGGDGQAFGGGGGVNDLVDSTGATTTVDFSASSVGYFLSPYRTGSSFGIGPSGVSDDAYDALTRSSLESPDRPRTFSVGGLQVNATYALYLYGAANHDQYEAFGGNAKFTVGAVTKSTTGANYARTSLVEGRDYVLIEAVSNASGVINITVDRTDLGVADVNGVPTTNSPQSRWTFNALQIVDVPAQVPEPGAIGVLLVAGSSAFLRRRQRHASA
ncbi:MAG TPA: PEP-CTERM sorting domain-containing protein [Tepidisphaeraceae bacterium]|jgi:hypothetical protein|nr:PEP-CTERM sorting domain-containing protein [Tepidisphaeraceae bacterium]